MKKYIIAILSVIIVGCSSNSYQPPCTELDSDNLTSLYFPVALGNKWSYDVVRYDGDTKVNEDYELDCTDEGGTNEFSYYKKVDGKWEWAEDIQSKIDELS